MTPRRPNAARNPLPRGFARKLRTLHTTHDPRLPALLKAAHDAGWTYDALGNALGCTRQNVQRICAGPVAELDRALRERIPVPDEPTAYPKRPRKPVPARLTADQIEQLRGLQTASRRVVGGFPVDSPARAASRQYSALLAYHRHNKVTLAELARAVGVKPSAIHGRLVRHGYLPAPPKVRDLYTGRPAHDRGGADPDAIQG